MGFEYEEDNNPSENNEDSQDREAVQDSTREELAAARKELEDAKALLSQASPYIEKMKAQEEAEKQKALNDPIERRKAEIKEKLSALKVNDQTREALKLLRDEECLNKYGMTYDEYMEQENKYKEDIKTTKDVAGQLNVRETMNELSADPYLNDKESNPTIILGFSDFKDMYLDDYMNSSDFTPEQKAQLKANPQAKLTEIWQNFNAIAGRNPKIREEIVESLEKRGATMAQNKFQASSPLSSGSKLARTMTQTNWNEKKSKDDIMYDNLNQENLLDTYFA